MLSNTCVGIHIYILKRYLSKWGAFHVHREVVRNGKGKLAKKKKQRREKKKQGSNSLTPLQAIYENHKRKIHISCRTHEATGIGI